MFTNNQLKTYLDFFEDDTNDFYEFNNGYACYHKKVSDFISDCYRLDIMDTDYTTNLEMYTSRNIQPSELIERADMDLLESILTYYIRGERFCEGMIANSFDDRVFERILNRWILLQEA